MLAKNLRLRKRTEFAYSFKHGQTANFKDFFIVIFERKDKLLRIGFSVSKKIGKAVVRNKVRRQMQAIVRQNGQLIHKGYNLIFVAKPSIINLEFVNLEQNLNFALTKKGLI